MVNDYDLDNSDSFITYTDLASIQVNAYGGNDRITARNSGTFTAANTVINGGTGSDFLQALNRSSLGSAFVNLDGGDGDDTLLSQSFSTSGGADTTLTGDSGDDTLQANNRSVNASATAYLDGGSGDDTIIANNFSDAGTAIALLFGRDGNDILTATNSQINGLATTEMRGGTGDDTYNIDSLNDEALELSSQGVDIVRTTLQRYELPTHVELLTATGSAQQLIGNKSANTIIGSTGNDVLEGRDGDDTLQARGGFDIVEGNRGDDRYLIDSRDTISEQAGEGRDEVFTSSSTYALPVHFELLTGTSRTGQTLIGNNEDNEMRGGVGADVFQGQTGSDLYIVDATDRVQELDGEGTDTVRTTAETFRLISFVENLTGYGTVDQRLEGNSLGNRIAGGAGQDRLVGNGGRDVLSGGSERDVFDFNRITDMFVDDRTTDIITDFDDDIVDLSTIDANTLAVGNQAFAFIGARSFTGAAGELRIDTTQTPSARTIITGDVDGDKDADFAIALSGLIQLNSGDFVL
jgi:Ca2+-binding RTX toxin-like protein